MMVLYFTAAWALYRLKQELAIRIAVRGGMKQIDNYLVSH